MERQEQVPIREEATPAFRLDLGPELPLIHPHQVGTAWPPPPEAGGKLPDAVFPQRPELLASASAASVIGEPHTPPPRRRWSVPLIYRAMRGWLLPYIESRLLPEGFHPIILAFCYNDRRVLKWVGRQALPGFQGLTGSFE